MIDGPADRIGERIKHISSDLKRYVEKRLELLVMNVGGEYSRWIAKAIQKIAGVILFFGAIILLLFALAFYLGALLNSRSLGFVLASIPLFVGAYLLFNLKPASVTKRLRSELEEELIGIFKADHKESGKLINTDSHEFQKEEEKKHDG